MYLKKQIIILIGLLLIISACGKSGNDSNSQEEPMPTEVIDERDHTSDVEKVPIFESNN